MSTIIWSERQWLTQQPWGQVHEGKPIQHYDSEAVAIGSGRDIVLKSYKKPKYFDVNGQLILSHIAVGLISSLDYYGYGYFEIEAKLPKGKNLHPAFWLVPAPEHSKWPPEIDIMEAYSENHNYLSLSWNWLLGKLWRVESNIHLSENTDKTINSLGAKRHFTKLKSPHRTFNKYALLWTPEEITILYNDKIVRSITDEQTLSYFKDMKMTVIINNGCADNKSPQDPSSHFVVNYFKYTPL